MSCWREKKEVVHFKEESRNRGHFCGFLTELLKRGKWKVFRRIIKNIQM